MTRSTDPSKNVLKIPPKFHDKAVQSNILWLNLNKIGAVSILHQQGNPSFHFHAPGSKHFPSAPVLYWLPHLTCISSLKAKNERKT